MVLVRAAALDACVGRSLAAVSRRERSTTVHGEEPAQPRRATPTAGAAADKSRWGKSMEEFRPCATLLAEASVAQSLDGEPRLAGSLRFPVLAILLTNASGLQQFLSQRSEIEADASPRGIPLPSLRARCSRNVKYRLTECSCYVLMCRPVHRGALHEASLSGAGCGTRGRASQPRPRAVAGNNHAGYYGSRISPATEKRESGQIPRGAPSWRGASADVPGLGDPSRPSNRAVRRNPDNAPSRRATPLIFEERKRREDGRTPAPKPRTGASMALAV
jgi:hypothetical protein